MLERRERRESEQVIDNGNRVIPKVPDSKCGRSSIAVENMFNRVTPDQALGTERRITPPSKDLIVV